MSSLKWSTHYRVKVRRQGEPFFQSYVLTKLRHIRLFLRFTLWMFFLCCDHFPGICLYFIAYHYWGLDVLFRLVYLFRCNCTPLSRYCSKSCTHHHCMNSILLTRVLHTCSTTTWEDLVGDIFGFTVFQDPVSTIFSTRF
jgi:hypothetical protein